MYHEDDEDVLEDIRETEEFFRDIRNGDFRKLWRVLFHLLAVGAVTAILTSIFLLSMEALA